MELTAKKPDKSITDEFWRRGLLRYKLDSTQVELYDLFYKTHHKIFTWVLARRSGKSYLLTILALEQCFKKSNSIVKYLAPTKLQINQIIRPLITQILKDCPAELKPEFKKHDFTYYFPNGSEIQLAGTDSGHAEKLRGGDSDLFFVDEAGSCDDLENIVKSILLPTTLITKGRGVLAGTPPGDSTHDFIKYMEEAEIRGSYIKRTVYDNPRITKEQLDELILELGGIQTEAARRELLCEIIRDSTTCVLPEFDDEIVLNCVKEWPKPPFYDAYVSMDLGFKDLTVVLFGYYDFRADKLIIEDEIVYNFQDKDMHLKDLADKITQKEQKLWTNPISFEIKKPYIRVSDIDYIALNELYRHSANQLKFEVPNKYDNEASINTLRIMLSNRKIIINPKCETLVRHMKNAKWQKNKKVFERSPDNGHYDGVDALKYMVKTVQYTKNPYPAHYGLNTKDLFVRDPQSFNNQNTSQNVEAFKKIFKMLPKRKW